jgi:hypothetical protein
MNAKETIKLQLSWVWWYASVIPATWAVEVVAQLKVVWAKVRDPIKKIS